jgi:hypothetical protein
MMPPVLTTKEKIKFVIKCCPKPAGLPKHCGHRFHAAQPYITRAKVGEWYIRVRQPAQVSVLTLILVSVPFLFMVQSKPSRRKKGKDMG